MAYTVEFAESVRGQLASLTARQRSLVMDAIGNQLIHEPAVETRNRKPMRPNPVAPWELRIGSLRVYYDVEDSPERKVAVRAVGIKGPNLVRIGREVIPL